MPGELDIFFNLTTIKNPLHPIQQHDTNYKSITLPTNYRFETTLSSKKKISSVENETGQTETIIRQEVNRFREFLFSKKKKRNKFASDTQEQTATSGKEEKKEKRKKGKNVARR